MTDIVKNINPDAEVTCYPEGLSMDNLDDFLEGVDIYVDSLDLFCVDVRREIFRRCELKGIPAVTAAPIGMGAACLIFMPGKMKFEDFFRLEGLPMEYQVANFLVGLSPTVKQRHYLMVKDKVNVLRQKMPALPMAVDMCAGVACSNVLKILLKRGKVIYAPHGFHYDAYQNRMTKTWRPFGNKNPMQRVMILVMRRVLGLPIFIEGQEGFFSKAIRRCSQIFKTPRSVQSH